jgi:hypothetical protein
MSGPNVVLKFGFVEHEDKLTTDYKRERYGAARRFYSCNQDFNYVTYTQKGSAEKIDYIAYSGDREKSFGVFGKEGLLSKPQQQVLKDKLRKTKSVIWFGVISFPEAFGQRYVSGTEEAARVMSMELPAFLKKAGFDPDNITWYAGLHENTSNKHIHFSFCENQPKRYRQRQKDDKRHFSEGLIYQKFLDMFKVSIEQRLTDITSELKIARKEVMNVSRELLFSKESQTKYMWEL